MARILVSLISHQAAPNLLLIGEFKDIDRYVFISTQQMEQDNRSDWLRRAANISEDTVQTIVVEQDSLVDIETQLSHELSIDDQDRFIVNITGGTKIMSIGVYNFFSELSSEMYYIYIGKNSFRKIFPKVKHKEYYFDYSLGFEEYLNGYGITIVNKETINSTLRSFQEALDFFNYFMRKMTDEHHHYLNQLRAWRGRTLEIDDKDRQILSNFSFSPNNSTCLDKHEIDYLTGGWFEEFIYHLIKQELKRNERSIGKSINIKRANVGNEFDVLFILKNTLYVIECKTGVYDSDMKRNFFNDIVYKIDSLSHDFGLRVRPYIFTTVTQGQERNQIKPSHIERAKLSNITIVDGNDLRNSHTRKQVIESMK